MRENDIGFSHYSEELPKEVGFLSVAAEMFTNG